MKRAILIPPIVGLFTGFLISFLFTPRYTSEAKMALLQPGVPSGYIVSTSAVVDEFDHLTQLALSPTMMRPALRSLDLVKPGQQEDQLMAEIRAHVIVTPDNNPSGLAPVFYVKYRDYNPARAQQVCQMVTTLIANARPEIRSQYSSATTEFLQRQLDNAKGRVATIEKELTKYRQKGKHRNAEEESRYRSLLRDYAEAKKFYADLLRKRDEAELSTTLENGQERVEAQVLEPATLPQSPDFPNRVLCALAGSAVGLAFAVTLALAYRSTSMS